MELPLEILLLPLWSGLPSSRTKLRGWDVIDLPNRT